MNKLIVLLLASFLSISMFSQQSEDYTTLLQLVSKAHNQKEAVLIYDEFDPVLKESLGKEAFFKMMDSLHTEKGTFLNYELILEEDKGKNFLVDFDNGSMLLFIELQPNKKISSFNIKDY